MTRFTVPQPPRGLSWRGVTTHGEEQVITATFLVAIALVFAASLTVRLLRNLFTARPAVQITEIQ